MNAGTPARLASNPENKQVLDFLSSFSVHSDVAEKLLLSTRQLGDVQVFCPNPSEYRYVATAAQNKVFGFATGMDTVAFKLGASDIEIALKTGGESIPILEKGWVSFKVFRSEWPEPDLRFWATKAYVEARK